MNRHEKYLRFAAHGASLFSTCSKAQIMAIIVDRYGTIVSTGYNGGPSGWEHCVDGGCPRAIANSPQGGSYNNCIAIHAESNALLRVSRSELDGATIYISGLPCMDCTKLIVGAGIKTVVYAFGRTPSDEPLITDYFARGGVTLIGIDLNESAVTAL